jgi:anthranilate synthase component 1
VRGRYSIIGFAPDLIWRAHADRAEINRAPSRNPINSSLAKAAR